MIKTDVIKPLGELLEERAMQYGSKVAYWDSGKEVSYLELNRQSKNISQKLRNRGLISGDKVAIYLPNSVNWVLACFGCVRAGLVSAPISYDAAPGEVSYRLTDSGSKFLITTKERLAIIESLRGEINADLKIIIVDDDPVSGCENFSTYCADSGELAEQEIYPSIDDVAFIVYTAGGVIGIEPTTKNVWSAITLGASANLSGPYCRTRSMASEKPNPAVRVTPCAELAGSSEFLAA